jgi:hypothetical protein
VGRRGGHGEDGAEKRARRRIKSMLAHPQEHREMTRRVATSERCSARRRNSVVDPGRLELSRIDPELPLFDVQTTEPYSA